MVIFYLSSACADFPLDNPAMAWWMCSSHLILAGTFLARNQTPALSDLRNITNGFIPEILAGQLRALIGQFEPSLASDWSRGWRLLTGHRSSFTPILDTRESAFRFTNLSLSLSTLTIPLLQKCRAAFSFYESFFNENDRASNWRNSVGPKH